MTRLALYQPDIAQNTGAAIRLCACLGVGLDIIDPCGFVWDKRKIRQSALDYMDGADLRRHISWDEFYSAHLGKSRIILMTTKASVPYTEFKFQPDDILLAGSESKGVPDNVHESVSGRVVIPLQSGMRSINVVNASAMILGEVLRQNKV